MVLSFRGICDSKRVIIVGVGAGVKPKLQEATLLATTAVAVTGSNLVATCDHLVITSKSNWRLEILTATKVIHVQLYLLVVRDFMIT